MKLEGFDKYYEARRLVDEYYATKGEHDIPEGDDVINDVTNDVIKFTKSEESAVKAIVRNPRLSAARLSELLGVKHRQAQRVIASLKKKAGLKRRGARKNGEWYFESGASGQ